MSATATKKKLMLAAILTSGLTLAISQAAWAEPANDCKPCINTKNQVISTNKKYLRPLARLSLKVGILYSQPTSESRS